MSNLNISEIRKSLNMTQLEFGELIGVDRRTIINYEQGKKIPATKVKILELMLDNGLLPKPEVKKEKFTPKKEIIIGDIDDLRREISDHKDHIESLKLLIEEKNKLAEMNRKEIMDKSSEL